MPSPIDMSRVGVSNHALTRWRERLGRPPEELIWAIRRAVPPTSTEARQVWEWMAWGRWKNHRHTRDQLRVCRETGAVFLLKPSGRWADGSTRWVVTTVTSLDLVESAHA